MPVRSEETWCICTGYTPREVFPAFFELRELSMRTGGNHSISHVPGFRAVTLTMYIPIRNCVRVIAEKKATIRFFLSVNAYRLSKEWTSRSVSLLREGPTVLLETLVRERCTRKTTRFEETRSCHTWSWIRIQRRSARTVSIRLERSDWFTIHEKAGSLDA